MVSLQKHFELLNRVRFGLAVACAVCLLAFYLFDYRPFTGRIARTQTLIAQHQAELRSNQVKSSDRNKIAAANERMRAELDQIRKPSKKDELPALIKEITLFGAQSSLKKFEYHPGVPTQSELFCEIPLALSFEGDFVNVFEFLRSSEQMQRLSRIRNMSIKAKNGKTGQVTATVAMNFYFSAD